MRHEVFATHHLNHAAGDTEEPRENEAPAGETRAYITEREIHREAAERGAGEPEGQQ